MNDTIKVFFGRTFSSEDIELIKWTKNKYPKLSRIELAKTLCEFWNWCTPAGLPKRVQCVAFLEKLEAEGVITLPPVLYQIWGYRAWMYAIFCFFVGVEEKR